MGRNYSKKEKQKRETAYIKRNLNKKYRYEQPVSRSGTLVRRTPTLKRGQSKKYEDELSDRLSDTSFTPKNQKTKIARRTSSRVVRTSKSASGLNESNHRRSRSEVTRSKTDSNKQYPRKNSLNTYQSRARDTYDERNRDTYDDRYRDTYDAPLSGKRQSVFDDLLDEDEVDPFAVPDVIDTSRDRLETIKSAEYKTPQETYSPGDLFKSESERTTEDVSYRSYNQGRRNSPPPSEKYSSDDSYPSRQDDYLRNNDYNSRQDSYNSRKNDSNQDSYNSRKNDSNQDSYKSRKNDSNQDSYNSRKNSIDTRRYEEDNVSSQASSVIPPDMVKLVNVDQSALLWPRHKGIVGVTRSDAARAQGKNWKKVQNHSRTYIEIQG